MAFVQRSHYSCLSQLRAHYENHFLALEKACKSPHRIIDILTVLFKLKLEKSVSHLAVGECLVHLNFLIVSGQMICIQDQQGVNQYQMKASGLR